MCVNALRVSAVQDVSCRRQVVMMWTSVKTGVFARLKAHVSSVFVHGDLAEPSVRLIWSMNANTREIVSMVVGVLTVWAIIPANVHLVSWETKSDLLKCL